MISAVYGAITLRLPRKGEEMERNQNLWTVCPVCGEQMGIRAGCDYCARKEAEADGHYGHYDLLNGWTCYASCPECYPSDEDEFE
jgi:hypothetical protein